MLCSKIIESDDQVIICTTYKIKLLTMTVTIHTTWEWIDNFLSLIYIPLKRMPTSFIDKIIRHILKYLKSRIESHLSHRLTRLPSLALLCYTLTHFLLHITIQNKPYMIHSSISNLIINTCIFPEQCNMIY